MSQPWKSSQWFVSPWNYLEESRTGFSFAKNIKIHDISLRDGEQQAGIEFRKDEKIRIAEKLAEAGVHRIEAGMPAVSKEDEAAVKEIVKRNLGPEIFAFARCMVDDVKRAQDCGVKGVVMEIPSSEHIIKYAYQWPLEKAIDLSVKATQYAKEQGLYTVFFPIDATRADMNWYLDLIEKISTEGHMDALALVDTFGVLSPHAVSQFVRRTKERIKKPLETHFHSDFGMGVANTIIALAEGAEVAHTTVTGIGERAGNTSMEETVLSLLTMYGIDVGLKYDRMYELSKMVREYARQEIPTNRPVVGELLYSVESGIIASWLKNAGDEHILEVFPYHWSLVGQRPAEIVMGKNSGIDSINQWMEKLGLQLNPDQANELVQEVKLASLEKKGLLTEGEFKVLADKVLGRR
ncbi:MAG: pyruvate carboxyltransferase [Chloroflexi bacterium]|nr:pyruvate carboxyltransferase [Chloroflexota bacterium]